MTAPAPTSSCFLDITASHEQRDILLDVVRRTAEQCFMPLTVGGGVRTVEDIRKLLLAGADKVVDQHRRRSRARSWSPRRPSKFGSQCIVVAIDAKRGRRPAAGRCSPMAAAAPTGLDAVDWAGRMAADGAGEILLTSMDRDGTGDGFDLR